MKFQGVDTFLNIIQDGKKVLVVESEDIVVFGVMVKNGDSVIVNGFHIKDIVDIPFNMVVVFKIDLDHGKLRFEVKAAVDYFELEYGCR